MKKARFIRLMALVLVGVCLLPGCKKAPESPQQGTQATTAAPTVPTQPTCAHTFSEWKLQTAPSCDREGVETRSCSLCGSSEERPVPTVDHDFAADHICRVGFNPETDLTELGNAVSAHYTPGAIANCAWDLVVWNGVLYRTAGDYDKNSKGTPIYAYNLADGKWELSYTAWDDSLHRFLNIYGVLAAPGIDPRDDWKLGNYYVLGEEWRQVRNLPGGIHNFDMIGYDGKIFAGLGVLAGSSPCAMSTDGGASFQSVPMYKDGQIVDTTGKDHIRIYEYLTFKGQLYAMAYMGDFWGFYRFEGDKFVYVSAAGAYASSSRTNYNYLNAKIELGDTCFVVSSSLHAIRDFADPDANKIVQMPNSERVSDALLADGTLYTLTYAEKAEGGYETVIYKSATGEEGSFREVLRFDYAVPPCSFTLDGDCFYIGMGSKKLIHNANGMVLQAKLP